MPKIIVTSTFRKGGGAGKKGGAGGLLKYMGTREGVEKLPLEQGAKPATKRQETLIESVIKKIPGTAAYPEYQKFLEQNTRASATEFLNAVIAKEDQAEEIGKLVTYMAERPGVVKLGKHGLFSQSDDPIELEKAAEEVANHPGYIWTHIVSLHREDAERLGYNNAEAWKSLVRRNVTAIAEAHRIPVSDLQWYAAFHDTGHHPHIHLMVYSKGQEGYLSKQSINQLRSAFGNDIFRQEQYHLFQLQTGLRQDIKAKSDEKIQSLIDEAKEHPDLTAEIHFLFVKLRKQLDKHKGKKVYGYLPKPIKETVNQIVAILSQDSSIEKLYDEWNEIQREKLSLYYENKDPAVPLVDNKEFRSIKNMVIRAVIEIPLEPEVQTTEQPREEVSDHIKELYEELLGKPYPDSTDTSTTTEQEETEADPPDVPDLDKPETAEVPMKEPTVRQTMAAAGNIIGTLAKLIESKCQAHRQSLQGQIDHKLQAIINEKKQALGIRIERTQKPTYQTEEEYEMSR